MQTPEIYAWLFAHEPTENAWVRRLWVNLASYCYFINTLDFDRLYQADLCRLLLKSQQHGIAIPNRNHQEVLTLVEQIKSGQLPVQQVAA
jgi:hypothetical protein